ncbi:hypothetical protein [Streptomyces sp. NBC_01363]|uniref:hypothetical protein n=1 Tax=Streptomyces sp. NBC_01363 TaxID=2903840 RepID=UPI002254C7C3|nr:hypothetical protein [Streptomyces sp. NBC_01363]MCX4736943.1 hypothetical protein [Streptomyces sp. NBC_01363]
MVAKNGSPVGLVRNEVGVVTHPGGCRYTATVLSRSRPDADDTATVLSRSRPGADDTAMGRAVGAAPSRAVAALRAGVSTE